MFPSSPLAAHAPWLSVTIVSVVLSATVGAQQTIPTHVLYEHFFDHVLFLEKTADRVAVKGLRSERPRYEIQREAKLTSSEDVVLKRIARESKQRVTALRKEIESLTPPREKLGKTSAPSSADRARLEVLWQQVTQVIEDGVQQLKASFGEERFKILNAYVTATIGSRIQYSGRGGK